MSIRTLLSERSRTTLYVERGEGGPVLLKVLVTERPSPQELRRFHNEVDVTQELRVEGVRRGLRKDRVDGRHALVLEYVEGAPLQPRVVRGARELAEFLEVAVQLAEILGRLHEQRVIHRDLKPANVILEPGTRRVTLIDFGISSRVDVQATPLGNPELLEGTLAYMSPEQTGRMNRGVDHRTDLYSLGATFFELLTGRPPFVSQDALELVHCHIARPPPAPHQLNPEVPEGLSALVLKLLAKSAEDRYQTAAGVAHDLRHCLAELERTGTIAPFALAREDASGRFLLPQKLYGREAEVAQLLGAFERASAGARELVLVAGYSGVGKSALVREVHRPITELRGHFIEGKFDQLQRGVPYSALIQAFGQLVDGLLTEGEATLAAWRARIQEAVEGLGRVLTPLLPNLELMLGPQPEAPALEGAEAQNRFQYVLRRFVRALCAAEHPLVLFVDDLQWADLASLQLLKTLLTDKEGGHFLLVGAWRDNEVEAGHPLLALLEGLREAAVPLQSLHMGGLRPEDTRALVADTLRAAPDEVAELAALVHEKTQGNAFFVRQLLGLLHEQRLLTFDAPARRWTWDMAQVRRLGITDNVVELMAGRLRRLPAPTQEALTLAACIGGRFDLATLATVRGLGSREAGAELWPAVEEGLLCVVGHMAEGAEEVPEYAFVHDRVQQAAYTLIGAEARGAVHLRVGRLLLERTPPERLEERLFDIVNQLDSRVELLTEGAERLRVARLNLDAGRRAAGASAYAQALGYFRTGLSLLGPDAWSAEPALALALHGEAAQAAYLHGDFAAVEPLARAVLAHARSPLEALRAYDALLMTAFARDRMEEVLAIGLEQLRGLGVPFPARPGVPHILAAVARTKLALRGRSIESLADLPRMTDESMLAAMRVVVRMIPAAFRSGSKLFPLLVLKLVGLSLRYGNMPVSVFGYAAYAITLCGVLGDLDGGYRFGKLSLLLGERFGVDLYRSQSLFVFNNFVRHWKEPLATCAEPMLESYRLALQAGSIFDAVWATFYRAVWLFAAGRELPEVERQLGVYLGFFEQDRAALSAGRLLRQVVANLTTPSGAPHRLAGEFYDEGARTGEATSDRTHLCFFHASKLQLCYLFGEEAEAVEHAEQMERHLEAVTSMPFVPLFHFYSALARLAVYRREPSRAALLRQARRSGGLLKRWAEHSPTNFRHKHALVEAELARATGRVREARELYDAALTAARASGFVQEEALTLERASDFYAGLGQSSLAPHLLHEALLAYRHWGATAKVEQLVQRFPSLAATGAIARARAPSTLASTQRVSTTHTSSGGQGAALDLTSLLKASGALAEEIVMERLLGRLIQLMVENAGATRGVLLLQREEELRVEAEAEVDARQVAVRRSVPLAEAGVCEPLVRYAARTQEPVVVADALADPVHQRNPYVQRQQVRSVLCVPIQHQGRRLGLLYLENNATPGAFSPERVEVLRLLSSQAAISLENAGLYASLERKVDERTAELQRKNGELGEALSQLRDTQKQLIAQEKLASLGALTAGIAHELQNPLNFVNNFAELSTQLADEVRELVAGRSGDKAALEEAADLLGDLRDNTERIRTHGRRATDIIKTMLQHSRQSSGARAPVDLNALVGETVNLARRGRQDADGVALEARLDPAVGRVEAVAGDLNRLFVNLLNNALYAARQKQQGRADFTPRVVLSTRRDGSDIEVRVRDNGVGIPEDIREKIFHPFFTTKPAGAGTGLGLSLCHTIVEQHQGRIRVESQPGEFTEFIITLPAARA